MPSYDEDSIFVFNTPRPSERITEETLVAWKKKQAKLNKKRLDRELAETMGAVGRSVPANATPDAKPRGLPPEERKGFPYQSRAFLVDGKICESMTCRTKPCPREAYAREPWEREQGRTIWVCHAAYMRGYRRIKREQGPRLTVAEKQAAVSPLSPNLYKRR